MSDRTALPADLSLADLNAHRGALAESMGIEILAASRDEVVARMPVDGNTQPYGLLHGGASVVLAETVGSIGSALHAKDLGKIAVGLDINATHHRAARSGSVTATARPVSRGSSVACFDVTIVDDEGERTCTSRITCILRDMPPGA